MRLLVVADRFRLPAEADRLTGLPAVRVPGTVDVGGSLEAGATEAL